MDSITLDQTMPISILQRDYNAVIQLAQKSKKPVVLVKHNKPVVRVLSETVFRQLKKFQILYEEERILRIAKKAREDYKQGKLISSTDVDFATLIGYEDK